MELFLHMSRYGQIRHAVVTDFVFKTLSLPIDEQTP
jgi:hypothetical protein